MSFYRFRVIKAMLRFEDYDNPPNLNPGDIHEPGQTAWKVSTITKLLKKAFQDALPNPG